MSKNVLFIAACLSLMAASPALAQIGSDTPQYSGPAARMDNGIGQYGYNRTLDRTRAMLDRDRQLMRRNDTNVERHIETRSQMIQNEMSLRREEAIRANQRHILKTNE